MQLEHILSKEELERIKKIGEIATKLKTCIRQNEEFVNLETQKILMALVDEDVDELIRDIVNDTFVEYIDGKATEGEQ